MSGQIVGQGAAVTVNHATYGASPAVTYGAHPTGAVTTVAPSAVTAVSHPAPTMTYGGGAVTVGSHLPSGAVTYGAHPAGAVTVGAHPAVTYGTNPLGAVTVGAHPGAAVTYGAHPGSAVTYSAPPVPTPSAVTYAAGAAVQPQITGAGLAPVTYATSSQSGAQYTAPQAVAELEQKSAELQAKQAELESVQQQFQCSAQDAETQFQNTVAAHSAHAGQRDAQIQALTDELNAAKASLAQHAQQVQDLTALNAGASAQLQHSQNVATSVTYAHQNLQHQRAVTYAHAQAAAAAPVVVHPHQAVTYGVM